ncbi:MAG: hypothetical protein LBV04_00105 [Deferribacteraceae bacterium]|jgi:triacylglycerol lipase|nr:hypothetical protein [Deferribacteraceae bacterium]
MIDTCRTKYPLLLIHGVGHRDSERFRYWGRIPETLETNGATIYYGQQDGWASIEYNAGMLKDRLSQILMETNCKKVNIIAHSKGGLDARCMISTMGMANRVASLTTIGSPHHGCKTMTPLLRLPTAAFRATARVVNLIFWLLGDTEPNFFYTCRQFSTAYMQAFNKRTPDAADVYYQSYAAVMKNSFSDWLLLWPNVFVSLVEGENDGLVTPKSAAWANFRGVLRSQASRGISHADLIDLRHRTVAISSDNGEFSDIREFYVDLVAELKAMGF